MTSLQHIFIKIKNNNVPIIIAALLIIYNYACVYDNVFGFSKLFLAVHVVYNILSLCVIFIHLYKIINHHLLLSALLFFYLFSSMVILISLIVLGLPKANYNLSLIVLFLLCAAAAKLLTDFLQQVNRYLQAIKK